MSISYAIKSFFGQAEDNDWLMEKYVITQQPKYLAKLYDNCADDLFHFLVSQSNTQVAQDICQTVWLRVIDKRHLYHSQQYFKSWLFTIGRNLLIDEIRSTQRLVTGELFDMAVMPAHTDDNELKTTFDHALMSLSFHQREAFILQQEGFSINQIAGITQTEAETIKSRLRFAKRHLREKLDAFHE